MAAREHTQVIVPHEGLGDEPGDVGVEADRG